MSAIKGAKIFKTKCSQCHNMDNSGIHKQGPNLFGVYGRTSGKAKGFAYSKANLESGITWNDESLSGFLQSPKKYIKGTKMVFAGIKNVGQRNDLIQYIKENCVSN